MSKNFTSKDFKAAVKSLNNFLEEEGEDKLKFVGVKKEVVLADFTEAIIGVIEDGDAEKLPEDVIDFYNTYIAVETEEEPEEEEPEEEEPEEEEPEEEPEESGKKKKKKKKTKSAAKPKKEKKEKKEKKTKSPGIIELGVKAYMEDGAKTKSEIIAAVQPSFPDRDISKTLSHVFGVVRHIRPYDK
jgi:outer membrane biosynthesis protein TonB